MTENKEVSQGFDTLGIDLRILKVLEQKEFKIPTPIQLKSIPVILTDKDIVGIAQTGTGKTLAFGIPMLQRVLEKKGNGLIILPTRELALQVEESLLNIGKALGIKTCVIIGGAPIFRQITQLRSNPDIIVATPGRLNDHIKRKTVKLDKVKMLVMDEADLMFDMGFAPQVNEILKEVPANRQTLLFSATMAPEVIKIATKCMKLPLRIEVAPAGTPAESVIQEMIVLNPEDRIKQLGKILKEYSGTVLIFGRTKRGVNDLSKKIQIMGHTSSEIHSNKSLGQRKNALQGFKDGKYRILVATDIAARGIDVKGIELVVNYDLPDDSADYIHRIGRTGRAGKPGRAISFATPRQIADIRAIEKVIQRNIPLVEMERLMQNPPKEPKQSRNRRSSGINGGKGSFNRVGSQGGEKKFGGFNKLKEGASTGGGFGKTREPRAATGNFNKPRVTGGEARGKSFGGAVRKFKPRGGGFGQR